MNLKLFVGVAGGGAGKALVISRPSFLIGRDASCQLCAASSEVSRRHCLLIIEGERVLLQDLGSKNGTFVNDLRVEGQVELRHKDRLRVGPLSFIVSVEHTAAPVAVAPPARPALVSLSPDEEAAALLLSGGTEPTESGVGREAGDESSGDTAMDALSTRMDLPEAGEANKPPPDTASAADAILKKYRKRSSGSEE
jgi:pSer/pThr/pTyr-binding forkhead associated (FHA) protein